MRAVIVLRPRESKRLIAKAVVALPEVLRAKRKGIICIGMGHTNAYVVEELIGEKINKEKYVAGYIDEGELKVLPKDDRIPPFVIVNGKISGISTDEALKKMKSGDVFIKGANAIDPDGFVGVLLASERGGTIGDIIGKVMAKGINLVVPIGLHKLIPSVIQAADALGIYKIDESFGYKVGMMPVTNAKVVTEVEAFGMLFGLSATLVSAGGIGDSEGAVVLSITGSEHQVKSALESLAEIRDAEF
ncbi:MAG: hypothetical protein J7L41_07595 [Synergistetes bacterium]|nr:hypothetical protein [Synergistota bacterium]